MLSCLDWIDLWASNVFVRVFSLKFFKLYQHFSPIVLLLSPNTNRSLCCSANLKRLLEVSLIVNNIDLFTNTCFSGILMKKCFCFKCFFLLVMLQFASRKIYFIAEVTKEKIWMAGVNGYTIFPDWQIFSKNKIEFWLLRVFVVIFVGLPATKNKIS